MFKKGIFVVLLWLFVHSFVQAAEGDLLFIVGKDTKRAEYDIFSSNRVSLESLIREIREGEIDKRVFGFSRLMDW
jgi:hypothetical protein